MFYIKNDNMEDMFKKAADDYELNEELAADWIKVRAILESDEISNPSTKEKKRRKFYLLWLLLLIPVTLFITYKTGFYFSDKKQHAQPTVNKETNKALQNKSSDKKNTTSESNAASNLVTANTKTNSDAANGKKIKTHNKSVSADSKLSLNSFGETFANNNSVTSFDTANADKKYLNNQAPLQTEALTDKNFNSPAIEDNLITNDTNSKQLNNEANISQTDKQIPDVHQTGKKNKTDNYTRQAFAYTTFTGNADISFIKFQKLSVPGFGLGIIGGYHFKNGISVETGVLYDKKNYYTKGEYFDKSKLSYLQNVNLLSANGNCHMWEIPLNFKYDFNSQKKHNWFVTAGFSSYIMNKEYYDFKYEKNGVVNQNAYDFYNSSQNWFSVLNIGGGINVKTGKRYFLQAQPYYKLPLSGIGKGNMLLSSAGINISVTRRLH